LKSTTTVQDRQPSEFARLLRCCESYLKIFGLRQVIDQKLGSLKQVNKSHSKLIIKLRFSTLSL